MKDDDYSDQQEGCPLFHTVVLHIKVGTVEMTQCLKCLPHVLVSLNCQLDII